MADTFDVNLPKAYLAKFPDRCVVCSKDNPDHAATIISHSIGWWSWMLIGLGSPVVLKPPACRKCARKLQNWRASYLLVTVVVSGLILLFVWPDVENAVPAEVRRWTFAGVCLIALIPLFLLDWYFPKPFEITAYTKSIDYEFSDVMYAIDFANLNKDAEWVLLNGCKIKH